MHSEHFTTSIYYHITRSLNFVNTLPDPLQYTFDLSRNPYAREGIFSSAPNERLDSIFVNSEQNLLIPYESKLVFDQPIKDSGETELYLSDHFGVLATFETQ
jgi:hypothetical protein